MRWFQLTLLGLALAGPARDLARRHVDALHGQDHVAQLADPDDDTGTEPARPPREQVVEMMAGGQELEELGHELEGRLKIDDAEQLRAEMARFGTYPADALEALRPLFVSRAPQRRNGGVYCK